MAADIKTINKYTPLAKKLVEIFEAKVDTPVEELMYWWYGHEQCPIIYKPRKAKPDDKLMPKLERPELAAIFHTLLKDYDISNIRINVDNADKDFLRIFNLRLISGGRPVFDAGEREALNRAWLLYTTFDSAFRNSSVAEKHIEIDEAIDKVRAAFIHLHQEIINKMG